MTSDQIRPILYGGATSPFARMAKLYGDLLGVDYTYEPIDIYNAEFIDQHNPLRQIPTLLIGDEAIYDSRTIFNYFAHCVGRDIDQTDFQQQTRISLALGMTDACLQYRMESMLPDGQRSDAKIEKLKQRIDRCVEKLDVFSDKNTAGEIDLEQIVLACALEYLDFRYSRAWRDNCTKLDAWMALFSEREDMQQSRPVG